LFLEFGILDVMFRPAWPYSGMPIIYEKYFAGNWQHKVP